MQKKTNGPLYTKITRLTNGYFKLKSEIIYYLSLESFNQGLGHVMYFIIKIIYNNFSKIIC